MTFTPYTERDPRGRSDQYQTISFLSEYANLSLEELRLEDYKQGRTGGPRPINSKITTLSLEMPLTQRPSIHKYEQGRAFKPRSVRLRPSYLAGH
jgi:hypothetical protein